MGRIGSIAKLIIEDFPDDVKEWVGKIVDPINEFISKSLQTINGGILFGVNITGEEKEFDFVYTATALPLFFVPKTVAKPSELKMVSAYENVPSANREFSPVIVALAWGMSDKGELQITDVVKLVSSSSSVASLTTGRRYKIKVRVTP